MTIPRRLFIGLAGAAALVRPAFAADKVTAGTLGGQAPLWPFYIAAHKGFFAAQNLDVEISFAQSGAAVTQSNYLFAQGITSGCAATTFCPNDSLTRATAAVMIVRAIYWSVNGQNSANVDKFRLFRSFGATSWRVAGKRTKPGIGEDASAKEIESGAPVHLTLDGF